MIYKEFEELCKEWSDKTIDINNKISKLQLQKGKQKL